ncbi:MAG: sigma-54-dependent Fis family transcriptional regulator [Myxococcales bacterium]|nr:sigma-54-dependent Fis family transcriptional regulator [Myxococcales bacterium]
MRFTDPREARELQALAALTDGNPFLPERLEAERAALGRAFIPTDAVWHAEATLYGLNPNLPRLAERASRLADTLRERLAAGAEATSEELRAYEALVRYVLYARYEGEFLKLIQRAAAGKKTTGRVAAWPDFAREFDHYFGPDGRDVPDAGSAAELFAWGYQIRRAFHHTYRQIHGGSMPAARLRAAVWQSIFTRDVLRYRRTLRDRMNDIPTLVTGDSGTGKELVARAIGLSGWIPFDAETGCFTHEFSEAFHAVNLSALSPTLIESELFGHRRGAFTGAMEDRSGWLETCPEHGTVFLDEIGELDAGIQVKLLRVLQTRTFQRIGETRVREFRGKIVAATNRDLSSEMAAGRFRPDFYWRLCADRIRTPSLAEQLGDSPGDLASLITVLARRIVAADEVEALAAEVEGWIAAHLGSGYDWPGNVRELEQCVRSILVRGDYVPPALARPAGDLDGALAGCDLPADALLRRYCTHVYARAGSYEEAARRLGLDRRTVKARVDRDLLARIAPR